MSNLRMAAWPTLLALLLPFTSLPSGAAEAQPAGTEKPRASVSKKLGEEDAIRKRREWFYSLRRPGSEGRMGELRLGAVEFTREQEALRRAEAGGEGAGVWTPRGPFGSTFGGWSFGRVAGRIPSLAKDFANDILYVGSASGGLWKSTNDGVSWTPLLDTAGTLTLGEVAVDPQDPDTLWVGTGENTMWCEEYFGIGLLRSTDGGATWQIRNGSGASTLKNLSAFCSIVIHPTNSNRLVVGGAYRDCVNGNYFAGGIFTTDDAGATWTERLSSKEVYEIVMDPTDPSLLWAGCGDSGLYRSLDGGNTWSVVTGLPTGSVGRVEVALAPSSPSTLYALFSSVSGSPQFYQSTNGGATWTLKSSGSNACDGQCWYNMVLRVNRTNPNTIYRGTVKLFRSTDGGATWSDLIGNWGGSQKVHQDIHALLTDPSDPDTFYVGCDGGIWKTSDGGNSFANLNANLSLTQFYDVGNHPTDDGIILGGAQDNSSLARTTSDTWGLQQVTGDGFVCAINPVNPNICYIAGYPSGNQPSVFRSTNGVWGPFSYITGSGSGITSTNRIAWVTPYTLDPNNPSTLYLGTYRAYRSTNGGAAWTAVGPSDMAGGSGTLSTLHVSRAGSSWVYAGTSTGRIWRSVDGGNNWSEISSGLPAGRAINDIETDPTDGTRAFCVVSGFNTAHLYEFSGSSWVARGTGLPNVPANSVLMRSPSEMYVGCDVGVFKSTDGGATFAPFSNGLAQGLVVTDLEYSPLTATITAGTYGRGAWQVTVGAPTCYLTCSTTVPATGKADVATAFQSTATAYNCAGSPTYAWTFGDGGTSSQQNPSHTYAEAGTYAWTFEVTQDGQSCSATGSITVEPPCSVACTATVPATANAGSAVSFKSTATPSYCTGNPTYAWTFGDGGTATLQNPSHIYAEPGDYPWTLTVSIGGATCTHSGTLTVTPPCSLTCTAGVPAGGTAGTSISFSASSTPSYCTGSPSYQWAFGDGQTSVQKNASHTYAEPGSYAWTLTVTLQGATCTQSGTILIAETCTVTCTAGAPATGVAGASLAFQASATTAGCAASPTFAWAFGDGGTSALQNPSHAYAAAGSYTWTLTVTADGETCSKTGEVVISEPCALSCTASATPTDGIAPLAVQFSATADAQHCAGTPTFGWAFGDGGTSAEQNPAHTYAAGTYTWTLTVTADGETCAQTGTVTVSEPCALSCAASATPAGGIAPLAVQFSATADAQHCTGAPTFAWSFGDGGTSPEQNPSHTYATAGTFTWTLTVTVDGETCAQTGTLTVTEPCLLACEASAMPATGITPLPVQFSATADALHCTGTPAFAWTFGDGGTSSEQNPNHTYAVAGTYTWALTVTVDGNSCTRTGTVTTTARIPGDADGDGTVSIGEVQQAVNMFLGNQSPGNGVDCNGDGVVSIGEVQKVINAFLGNARTC